MPNTSGLASSAYGATLRFAAYGSSAGTLRVATTGSSGSFSASVAYTTTLAYYTLPFTLTYDATVTIFLGGATPGAAVAQTISTLKITDWSMYVGNIQTSLEGSLSLVNGTLSALTVASNVASTSYMDVQKSS